MSNTDRHEKTFPRERAFPYVPRGVRMISTGPANGPEDNSAYVRTLLAMRQPEFYAALQKAVRKIDKELNNAN